MRFRWNQLLNQGRELEIALFCTSIARMMSTAGAVLFGVVLGQTYGAAGVGLFALAQSVMLGASILARLGLANTLVLYVSRHAGVRLRFRYLRWAFFASSVSSIAATVTIFGAAASLENLFGIQGLKPVIRVLSISLLPFTLAFILAGFFKGIGKPAAASLMENGAISFVAAFLVLLANSVWPENDVVLAAVVFCGSAWLVLGQGLMQVAVWRQRTIERLGSAAEEKGGATRSEFCSATASFFVANIATFLNQVVGFAVVAAFLAVEELGLFKTAERASLLIAFPLVVTNAVFAPRFSKCFASKDLDGVKQLAKKSSLFGVIISAPLVLVCLIAPAYTLQLFGEEFTTASNALRILAAAQLFNVATGSVSFVLNMVGHHKVMRNIAIVSSLAGLASLLVLTPLYGLMGASLGMTIAVVVQNMSATIIVKKRLGFWVFPISVNLSAYGRER